MLALYNDCATELTPLKIKSFLTPVNFFVVSYIDEFDSISGKPDVNKHGHFYSLCQVSEIFVKIEYF